MDRALLKNAADRFPTARAFADALRTALPPEPLGARGVSILRFDAEATPVAPERSHAVLEHASSRAAEDTPTVATDLGVSRVAATQTTTRQRASRVALLEVPRAVRSRPLAPLAAPPGTPLPMNEPRGDPTRHDPDRNVSRLADEDQRPSSMASPRIFTSDANQLTAAWGPVFLTIWRDVARVEVARDIQLAVRDLAASLPGRRVACLTVIEEHAALPNTDARAAVADILRFNAESIACSTNVVEGTGFRPAAIRAIVTGIGMLARQQVPHRVSASVGEASVWICQKLSESGPTDFTAADLVAVVEDVRGRPHHHKHR